MTPGEPFISHPPEPAHAAVALPAALGPGSFVGPFTIEARIGQGGMATIYRARQDGPRRFVALKVIREDHAADPEYSRRFLDEAETLATLEHPAIVPIYAAGAANGVLYIAMRLVGGPDLQSRISRESRLGLRETVAILEPIADAIDYAHAMGIIHRDLKPSNIIVDAAGHPYLTDFGVGKRIELGGSPRAPAIAMGTLDFMAPEQVVAAPVDPSLEPAIDTYALGCVAYTCLTGRPPFLRETRDALLYAHAYEFAPSIRAIVPEAPAALDGVFARVLAKDPAARFASARSFVAALDSIMRATAVSATSSPPAASGPIAAPAHPLASATLSAAAPAAAIRPVAAVPIPDPGSLVGSAIKAPPAVGPRPAPRRRRGLGSVAVRSTGLAVLATVAVAAGAAFVPDLASRDPGGAAVATPSPRATQPSPTTKPDPATAVARFPNTYEAQLLDLQPSHVETTGCASVPTARTTTRSRWSAVPLRQASASGCSSRSTRTSRRSPRTTTQSSRATTSPTRRRQAASIALRATTSGSTQTTASFRSSRARSAATRGPRPASTGSSTCGRMTS